MEDKVLSFDVPGIMSCQLNRYPMLFIDQVTECVPLKYANGYKLFTYNEWYFHEYNSTSPKVWNTIQIEAMSQIFLMTFLTTDECRGNVTASNKFNNVQFFRKIVPGDKLEIEATLDSFRYGVARGKVRGVLNGVVACSMECTIVVPKLFAKFQHALTAKETKNLKEIKIQENNVELDIDKIRECIPNKYPCLYIDRVVDIEPGKFVKAIKNFTYNEFFFPAHFPNDPSVPGFIQIESCMQCFLLTFLSLEEYKNRETFNRLLMNVQLKRKIIPGETLEMFAQLKRFSCGVAKGHVEGYVNGEPAISFDVTSVVVDELDKFKPKVK
jgi:3-hydroxyacyl-[acyl-carrier-protein] dehydratase